MKKSVWDVFKRKEKQPFPVPAGVPTATAVLANSKPVANNAIPAQSVKTRKRKGTAKGEPVLEPTRRKQRYK